MACVGAAPAASAAPTGSQKLQNALTVKNIVNHERQLAAIAGRNGNTRASGTPGYDKSVDYVSKKLRKAGYKVTKQTFLFPYFEETAPASFERVSPQPKTYTEDEFSVMQYSGSGTAEGKIVPGGRDRPADAGAVQQQRLRGRRLRRLHGGSDRAGPARHVRLRRQGPEREGGRRIGRGHLQRGPAGPHRR